MTLASAFFLKEAQGESDELQLVPPQGRRWTRCLTGFFCHSFGGVPVFDLAAFSLNV